MLPLSAAYAIKKKNPHRTISQKVEAPETMTSAIKPSSIVEAILAKRLAPKEDLSDEAFMQDEAPEETEELFSADEPEPRSQVIRKILQGLRNK